MFSPWTIIGVIVVYVAGLFAVAQWAERTDVGRRTARMTGVYALGLAVYCTTWTYYGSVGKAATGGMGFLPVYLGPTLGFMLGWTIFRRIVRLKHAHRITSIADFISGRYGKSQAVAALVTTIMMIGIIPYVGLQLKAVTGTFAQMTATAGGGSSAMVGWFSPIIAVFMALFTIVFGIRHLDPTERHPGMVAALAFESVFKLLAFLAAGIFIVGSAFGGLGGFMDEFATNPPDLPMLKAGDANQIMIWLTVTVLSMSAFAFLPRQFHVGVVENGDPEHVRSAAWLTPLFLITINLLVVPIAMGGAKLAAPGTTGDQFVLAIPVQAGQSLLSMGVFVGGFSAAFGMIMISSMTMATMISNHLVMPVVQAVPSLSFLRSKLLYVRWFAATAFIFSGYGFEVGVGDSYMLVAIGLISFAAAFIVAPVVLLGLFWRDASRGGAILGLSSGFVVWGYSLFMPSLIKSGWLPGSILEVGPFGWSALKPEALLGLGGLPSLTHGVLFSGGVTVIGLVVGSIVFPSVGEERALTDEFLDEGEGGFAHLDDKHRTIDAREKWEATIRVLAPVFDLKGAETVCRTCFEEVGIVDQDKLTVVEMAELHNTVERHLAGAIGAASAHGAMREWGTIDRRDSKALAQEFGRMLAKLKLSPKELKERIDFQTERDALLDEQFAELQTKIDERDAEIVERQKAEVALQAAHDELEDRVAQRTAELNERNASMRLVFDTVDQGFLTIDLDGKLGSERSRVVDEWFHLTGLGEGTNICEALRRQAPAFTELLEVSLEQVRDSFMPLDVTIDQLPRKFMVGKRHYEVAYHPTADEEAGEDIRLLVVISDATARVEAERLEERQKEVLALFDRLVHDRGGVLTFLADANTIIGEITSWRPGDDLLPLKRNLHTLKGNAAILGVTSISRICHDMEDVIADTGTLSKKIVGNLYTQWEELRGRIDELVGADGTTMDLDESDYEAVLQAFAAGRPREELESMVRRWRLEPTRRALGRLAEQAARLSSRVGKGNLEVVVEDNGVRLEDDKWGKFWSTLVHAVRNAVDHGIEPPGERQQANKPEKGRLTLRTEETEDAIVIDVSDDGRGIAWDKLRRKALEAGLPAVTQNDLIELLFADGISTRDEVTDLSGRGVGMATIRAEAAERGGVTIVRSEPGKGMTLSFRFEKKRGGKESAA